MEDWQRRVLAERAELAARLDRLNRFLDGGETMQLSPHSRVLLIRQQRAMTEYLPLDDRIALFSLKDNRS